MMDRRWNWISVKWLILLACIALSLAGCLGKPRTSPVDGGGVFTVKVQLPATKALITDYLSLRELKVTAVPTFGDPVSVTFDVSGAAGGSVVPVSFPKLSVGNCTFSASLTALAEMNGTSALAEVYSGSAMFLLTSGGTTTGSLMLAPTPSKGIKVYLDALRGTKAQGSLSLNPRYGVTADYGFSSTPDGPVPAVYADYAWTTLQAGTADLRVNLVSGSSGSPEVQADTLVQLLPGCVMNIHITRIIAGSMEYTIAVDASPLFTDPLLESRVRHLLGAYQGIPTADELASIDELRVPSIGIRFLGGIEALKGLEILDISGNDVNDLGLLAGLPNLTQLDIAGNPCPDLSALSGMKGLNTLVCGINGAKDSEFLRGMTGLETLILKGGPLHVENLRSLPSLWSLTLDSCSVTGLSGLGTFSGLRKLDISDMHMTAPSWLGGLAGVGELGVRNCGMPTFPSLPGLAELSSLDVSGNTLTNTEFASVLTNLERLDLSANRLTDISTLKTMLSLVWVDLRFNPLDLGEESVADVITTLKSRGCTVEVDE